MQSRDDETIASHLDWLYPPSRCDKEGRAKEGRAKEGGAPPPPVGARRALGALAELEEWQNLWREHFICWWVSLPGGVAERVSSCMGALGVHLGSRLDAAWRAANRGKPALRAQPEQTAEAGCEWLQKNRGEVTLPEFPVLPISPHFELPPMRRLLPSSRELMRLSETYQHGTILAKNEVGARDPQSVTAAAAAATATAATAAAATAATATAAASAAGLGVGAALTTLALSRYWKRRRLSKRPRVQLRGTRQLPHGTQQRAVRTAARG